MRNWLQLYPSSQAPCVFSRARYNRGSFEEWDKPLIPHTRACDSCAFDLETHHDETRHASVQVAVHPYLHTVCTLSHVILHIRHFFVYKSLLGKYVLGSCAIEVGVELPPEAFAGVVEPHLLVHRRNLLHILRVQLEVALQVRLDPVLRLALGDDRSSWTRGNHVSTNRSPYPTTNTLLCNSPCAMPHASAT